MAREIALLTNPTSGKGLGSRTSAIALPRLREAGFHVRRLEGRDADEARDLARQAVDDGVETLVVVGGDGMVHLGVQAVAHSATTLGIIPAGTGNDAARYFGIPRRDPQAAADVVVGGPGPDGRPGQDRPDVLPVRAVRRLRRDRQRAGQPDDLAAGADALQPRDAGRAARLRAAALHPRPRRRDRQHVRAMLVAVGNGPSFGGGLRITEGAVLDDGLLDVVFFHPITKPDLLRTYPKLFKGTHTSHPAYEHHRVREVTVAAPGIVAYADGERLGPLPLTVTADPGALKVLVAGCASPVRALREVPGRAVRAGARGLPAALRLPARRLPGPRLRGRRGRRRRAGRRADRVGQDDRRGVRGAPRPAPGPQVLLHHADQGAVEPEVRRPGPPLRRRQGRAADRRQHGQRRGAGRRDDHRGAAQHALRRLARR